MIDPDRVNDKTLNAVSEQYYNALVFHAETEVGVSELWMLGIDPISILDRALTAERFDPPTCNPALRLLSICECVTCKRTEYRPFA